MNSSSFSAINPATGEQIETFPLFFCPGDRSGARARRKELPIVSKAVRASTCTTPLKPRSDITEEPGTAGESNHNREGKDSLGG
jgi:hypothetical protein